MDKGISRLLDTRGWATHSHGRTPPRQRRTSTSSLHPQESKDKVKRHSQHREPEKSENRRKRDK